MNRVEAIVFHERSADQLQAKSDEHRWDAARLIAEELATGKTQRQLGAEIGKDHRHVARMAGVWRTFGDPGPHDRPPFTECYNQIKGGGTIPWTFAEVVTRATECGGESMVRRIERGDMTIRHARDVIMGTGVNNDPDDCAEAGRRYMRTVERAATTIERAVYNAGWYCTRDDVDKLIRRLQAAIDDLDAMAVRGDERRARMDVTAE